MPARTLPFVLFLLPSIVVLVLAGLAPPARADELGDGGAPAPLDAQASSTDASAPAPQEVTVRGGTQVPPTAADVNVGQAELALQPRLRAEQVLEEVPGLFTVQHSGGAKAQQYFLRGFDADHGTDIAFFADGVPLNAVSHAHGQGYTDLHFVIPELIAGLHGAKGPFATQYGDFATAGAVDLHFVEDAPESLSRAELGPWGRSRGVIIESPRLGEKWRIVIASELFTDNGYFVHPEQHRRANGYGRIARALDDDSELSLTLMGYGASWNASGTLPARAVCGEGDGSPPPSAFGAPCVGRTDAVDPTQGGRSQRMELALSYRLRRPTLDLTATVYVINTDLALFLDDTLFASDPIHGDEIEQNDLRTVAGITSNGTKRMQLFGMDTATSVGIQLRSDTVANSLHHDEARARLGTLVSSDVQESALGLYVEEVVRPAAWVRFSLGARADRIDMAVIDADPSATERISGVQSGGLVSPKWSAVVTPFNELDLFLDYGRGFHSNDARGVVGGAATLLAVATGYEVGARFIPLRGLAVSAAAYLLDLTSELVFDGDTGSTYAAGATRREGVEVSARYRMNRAVFADLALTFNRARFLHDEGTGTLVPLAPTLTFVAGVGVQEPFGPLTASGAVRVRSMADRPATQDGSIEAQGFTLVDAQAGLRWKGLEVTIDVLNALDATWREGQFAVTSRMKYEPVPVTGLSFTPGWPREVLAQATLYW